MNIFDILGPVMVGPSSSHTAGACRIGYIAYKLMGEKIAKANIGLYGSFLYTGKGHGTTKAIVAGLLGLKPDNEIIPYAFEEAKKAGMEFTIGEANLKDANPNSVSLNLIGKNGKILNIVGESIGGGRVNIAKIDGLNANFSGDYPTLICSNTDVPGMVAKVSSILALSNVNIANLQLYRSERGKNAVFIVECDREIDVETREEIASLRGIAKSSYLSLED